MTIGIAAIAYRDHEIVLAADFLLSAEVMSTETNVSKIEPLSKSRRWWGCFSGVPSVWNVALRHARPVLDKTRKESVTAVKQAFRAAFRDGLREKIEDGLLSPLGLDRKTFLKKGRGLLGKREFAELLDEVRGETLGTDALLAGFEPEGAPRLVYVSDRVCRQEEHVGFHAVGMGNTMALASLFTTYDRITSATDLIYRVCEAKFLAERALGVSVRFD